MSGRKDTGIVHLHGRQYRTVALRVQLFREHHPLSDGWGLVTKLIEATPESVLFRAAVIDPQGREVAVGFAEEVRTNRGINKTSALENCETSAIGRALSAAGFGGSEYASADELANAIHHQRNPPQQTGPQTGQAPAQSSRSGSRPKHHPSWTRHHKAFLAGLQARGLQYEAVAAYCVQHKWGRPATWITAERERFLDDLDAGSFADLYTPAPQQEAG